MNYSEISYRYQLVGITPQHLGFRACVLSSRRALVAMQGFIFDGFLHWPSCFEAFFHRHRAGGSVEFVSALSQSSGFPQSNLSIAVVRASISPCPDSFDVPGLGRGFVARLEQR